MTPIIVPIRCKDCIHLKSRMENDIMLMDLCEAYGCEITDELLDQPCPHKCEWFWDW